MGAVKSLATDSLGDLISYANAIARDRDRYQDEARRLRDLNTDLLAAIKEAERHCGVIPLPKLRALIGKAEAH